MVPALRVPGESSQSSVHDVSIMARRKELNVSLVIESAARTCAKWNANQEHRSSLRVQLLDIAERAFRNFLTTLLQSLLHQ